MAKKNKSEEKLEEANFEVSSLDEVKDENGNGIFHMRTKTKIIAAISLIILAISTILIYLTVEKYFGAQMWQVIVWGLCGILSLYAIFARSIAALLLNIVLFFGLSFFPAWQSGYETFQPVIEKFSTPAETPQAVEDKPAEKIETPQAVEDKQPAEKIETPKVVEDKPAEKIETPKVVEDKPAEKIETPQATENKSDNEKISENEFPRI